MTLEEARGLVGSIVLYSSGTGEPEEVVITHVGTVTVRIAWPGREATRAVTAGDLMRLPGTGTDPAATSQARINEFAAAAIRTAPWDPMQAQAALEALRELNWAAGFDFEGVPPRPPGASREYHAGMAARHLWGLEVTRAWEKRRAEIQAEIRASFGRAPEEAAALLRRSKPSAPALVYVVTHPALRAVKIGVSDAGGERIAVHRRAGWQLTAAFRVTARAAATIEAGILDWWRRELGLPAYLSREQMPQGGCTETAAAVSIDLAATVTRICAQAVSPEAQAAPLARVAGSPVC